MPLVTFHDKLVRPANHVDVVSGVELGHDVTAEQISSTSRTNAPAGGVWVRQGIRSYNEMLMMKNISAVFQKSELPSGSDHKRSHMGPSWGTSCFLSMVLIWSRVWIEGDRPPCTQKIWETNPSQASVEETRDKGLVYPTNSILFLFFDWTIPLTNKQTHFSINDGWEGQVVEDLCAVPPYRDRAVFSQTLIVKAVHLRDLSGLVISPN